MTKKAKKKVNFPFKCVWWIQALEITSEFNCVTEFILEAQVCIYYTDYVYIIMSLIKFIMLQEWAKELDTTAALTGKRGPLHGLPFSVKDNVGLIGYDSTIGISRFINEPAIEDAAMVIALKKLGAIPFCKTNVPQTNMR